MTVSNQDAGAALLRISLGVMWLTHGVVLKAMTFGVDGLASWLPTVGLPGWWALPLILAESIGGALLIAGVYGRWVSAALLPILVGALVIHAGNGWVFSNAGGGWEYPLFLIATSAAHVLIGDGAWAFKPALRFIPRRQRMA